MKHYLLAGCLALGALVASPAAADPLRSGLFDHVAGPILGGLPHVFDERVVVLAPAVAEDNMNLPVLVDARALGEVERIVVFADANPITKAFSFEPLAAEPFIAVGIKIQQGSPVRAAALTPDGVWHVGGRYVDAAGGGCTAPATVHAQDDWPDHLGKLWGRAWPEGDGLQRLKVRAYHPMDTGLADGIPAFFIRELTVTDADGTPLARIQPLEPVSEHPLFTLLVRPDQASGRVVVTGSDNEGHRFRGIVPLSWQLSQLALD